MIEIRRPVFVSGENPGLTLYAPGTDRVMAVTSYWNCVASPWGIGHALVLWLKPEITTDKVAGRLSVFTDNLALAQGLVNSLTQYFTEFQGVQLAQLDYLNARCQHTFDGDRYHVVCQTDATQIEIVWGKILDRKQVIWSRFPAGSEEYDLTTVICPCDEGQVKIDDVLLDGKVQTTKSAEGVAMSSAFLAFAETWIGPLTGKE